MKTNTGKLDFFFRALGESAAIVLLSCGTYVFLTIDMEPESMTDSVEGVIGCGGPLLALIWFITRTMLLGAKQYQRVEGAQSYLQTTYPHESVERADLRRVAIPSTKQKKRKRDVVGASDSVYLIQGRGTQATDPVDLDVGMYRLAYQFAPGVPTTIKLLQRLGGEEKVLLDRIFGAGSRTFTVEEAERYIFQVSVPGIQVPAWTIEVERL